eukprot:7111753-Prymnesium_polylepis.1
MGVALQGTVQSSDVTAVSDITLAVFEDAGWYVANYSVGGPRCFYEPRWCASPPGVVGGSERPREPMLWGQGRGCGFVGGRCNQRAWQGAGYFCDELPADDGSPAEGCTLGRRALGFCTLVDTGQTIAPQYQYFPNPQLGGKEMEDFCPLWEAYNGWDCRFAPADPHRAQEIELAAVEKGEQRCESCRCFSSSLFNSSTRFVTGSYFG